MELQQSMRELVALSALPATWVGLEPRVLVESLASAVRDALGVDFVYVGIAGSETDARERIEVASTPDLLDAAARARDLGMHLAALLDMDDSVEPRAIANPLGEGTARIATARIANGSSAGSIVAGSRRADFPTGHERLLLSFVANQAALALQGAQVIAERRQADERRALYREIIARSSDAIAIVDPQGAYLEQNAAHERLIGYSDADLAGQTPAIHMGDETFALVAQDLATSGQCHREIRSRTKSGQYVEVELSAFAVRDPNGAPLCYVGIKRDITEHKRAEAARAALLAQEREARAQAEMAEQRFHDLVDALDAIVWEADAATFQFTFVNQRAEEILGYPAAQWLSEPHFWADHIHPDDRQQAVGHCLDCTSAGRDHAFDYRGIAADGRTVWLRDIVRVVRDETGQVRWLRGVMVDITERKEAETVLREAHEQLERRVEERTADLRRVNARLTAEMEERKQQEERLRRSERQLAEALHIAHLGSWEWDIVSNTVHWSDELYEIYGLTPGGFGGTFEAFLERIHPDDRERVRGTVTASYRDARSFEFEHRIVRPDGRIRQLHGRGEVVVDDTGRPVRMAGTGQDVTERKQAEERARQLVREQVARAEAEQALAIAEAERRRLRELLIQAPAAIAILDGPAHTFTFVNLAYERLSGRSAARLVGKGIRAALPEVEGQGFVDLLDEVYRSGKPAFGSEAAIKLDRAGTGTLDDAFVSFVLQPMPGLHADVAGIFVLAVEVTEQVKARRRVEKLATQLETERARLEAVLEQMPAGVVIAEAPSGRVVLGNARVRAIWRQPVVTADHVGAYDAYQGFHRDGRRYEPDEWPLARSIATGEIVSDEELAFVRADGERGVMRVSSVPIRDRDGAIVAAVVVFDDVTEQTRAFDALRFMAEASSALAGSLDYETTLGQVARLAVPDLADWCAVDIMEADGSVRRLAIAHVDPAKIALVDALRQRYPLRADAPHGVAKVLRTCQAELYPEIADDMLAALAEDAEHLSIIRGLGLTSAMVVPLVARGRVHGVVSLVSATPGRRYGPADLAVAEELARRAALAIDNAHLYREVQQQIAKQSELNAALREAVGERDHALADLHKLLQTRDEFLSAAAHDLKTPLASLKGMAQLLQRRAARSDSPDVTALADGLVSIDTAATKMTALVNELLDLARLQLDQTLDLDRRPTDLAALARHVASEHQQTTERHVLRVETIADELIGLWDVVRLERAFSNLITNAIKYSPDGGEIVISVTREDGPDGAWATLAVRDGGLGIPAADLPRLFERFHRGGNVVGHIGGTGVGLASVHHTVESHGGTVTVESEEGKGSTFTVRLPLDSEEASAPGLDCRG